MIDALRERQRILTQAKRAHVKSIGLKLKLLHTYAAVAETYRSCGNRKHAARLLAEAERRYSMLLQFHFKVNGMAAELDEQFQSKLKQVRERLNGLRRLG